MMGSLDWPFFWS